MGKGQKSKGGTRSSTLSREQARILSTRDAEYRAYYAPILREELKQTADGTQQSRLTDHAMGAVNQQYNQAKDNLVRSLDQREVEGGFRNSALANLEVARANAAADVQKDAYAANKQQRSSLLSLGMGMSPKPTQAVAYHQKSSSKPWGLMQFL
jgi:hypothetical protein